MIHKLLLAALLPALGTATNTAYVLDNGEMRFGNGEKTSVNDVGNLLQPFYFSYLDNRWHKLTYSNYPLDMAAGMGFGFPNWSGANVTDFYSLTPTANTTDWSQFVVTNTTDITQTGDGGVPFTLRIQKGYGNVTSTRSFMVGGKEFQVVNTYRLGRSVSFLQVDTRFINIGNSPIWNARIWVGTKDDYVGRDDDNVKTRGNIASGAFQPLSLPSDASNALLVNNEVNETILFFSTTPGVNTAWNECCYFSNVYNQDPSTNNVTSEIIDGSYAITLLLGSLEPSQSRVINWFYGAGPMANLSAITAAVSDVASQFAYSPLPTPSPSPLPIGVRTVLGVAGGSAGLFAGDVNGLATSLRAAIAAGAGIDSSRVVITTVTEQTFSSGMFEDVGSALHLNETSAANNGTGIPGNRSAVWQSLAPTAPRRLQDACSAVTSASGYNTSTMRTAVTVSLDSDGLTPSQIASLVAALGVATSQTTTFTAFATLWSACTGAPADPVTVITAPFSSLVFVAPRPALPAGDASLLGSGAVAALAVGLILGCLTCACFLLELRRRCHLPAEAAQAPIANAACREAGLKGHTCSAA